MASIFRRPRSPFWFCSYRSGDGRWLKKSTKQTDRRKALEFCHKLEDAERAALSHTLTTAQARKLFNEILERAGDEPLDNFTVKEWLCEWVAAKRAARGEKTGERYGKPVKDFIAHLGSRANLPLRAVTPKDVRSFRDGERRKGKSPVTANLAHKIVASALGAAVKMGYITTNPAVAVDSLPTHEAKAQKETFTPEEIARLLDAAPSDDWRGVILLGALAGMRLGDGLRLKWGNVDLQAGAITFAPSKTARLGKRITMPIHPEVEAFLLKHPTGASDNAPLFPSLANLSTAGKSGASMAFRRIMERAGVGAGIARRATEGGAGRNVSARSFHSLRHSFVTGLAHANVSVELRQKLAGHASEEQSLHYTHPQFAALRAAIEKLPGLRNA
jgi:integrase